MVLFVLPLERGVFIVELGDVAKSFADLDGHVTVQITHILICVPLAYCNEVLGVFLSHVVLKPWEVELIVAETDEVQKRLDVVDRVGLRLHVELAH